MIAAAQGAVGTSAAASGRVRPLIYVYNIPDEVVSHILQYRTIKMQCGWRTYTAQNATTLLFETYGLEVLLPDLLLGSGHRTLDPQEADFFYVPVLASCWMTYLQGIQDGPWFNVDRWGEGWAGGSRASAGGRAGSRAEPWRRVMKTAVEGGGRAGRRASAQQQFPADIVVWAVKALCLLEVAACHLPCTAGCECMASTTPHRH
jgi:hypothetical protein